MDLGSKKDIRKDYFNKSMGLVKKILTAGKEEKCSRCDKTAGLLGREPDEIWGFQGKLCRECYHYVKSGIQEYDATYIEGYSNLPTELEGKLFIYLFDNKNKVIFRPKKSNYTLQIPSDLIIDCKITTKSKSSMKKAVLTAGLARFREKRYLQIDFIEERNKETESALFDLGDKVDVANNTIYLIKAKTRDEETSIASETEEIMEQKTFCNNCGTPNDMEARFCSRCGSKLFEDDEGKGIPTETRAETYDASKEKAYFRGEGEVIVKKTEHRGAGRKIASWLVAGAIGYVAFGMDKKTKSKAKGTLVVTNKSIYCSANVYPYDKVLAISRKGKSIMLLFEKDFSGQRFSVTLELRTKDIDGLFRALETARMSGIEF